MWRPRLGLVRVPFRMEGGYVGSTCRGLVINPFSHSVFFNGALSQLPFKVIIDRYVLIAILIVFILDL